MVIRMSSGNESLLETYLFESNSLVEQLEEILMSSEESGEFSTEEINEIFRGMHTIKGSSAMMEFEPIMEVAHHVEDLFFEIREHGMDNFTEAQRIKLFELLFKSNDMIKEDLAKVEAEEELDREVGGFIKEISKLLNEIKGIANTNDSGIEVESEVKEGEAPYNLIVSFEENCGMEHIRAFIIVNFLRDIGLDFEYYPKDVESNADTIPALIEKGFKVCFFDEAMLNIAIENLGEFPFIKTFHVVTNIVEAKEVDEAEKATLEVEKEVVVAKSSDNIKTSNNKEETKEKNNDATKIAKQSLISVSLDKLDELMAIVGEIVITESMVVASEELKGLKLDGFLKSTRQLRKLTDDLQDIAMSLRMVPISGVFQKMNRIVRDMSKSLNKDVKFITIGGDAEVDKSIVDNVADPIMHMVRNAMDHGIEDNVEERIAAGKNPKGEVILSAKHVGSEIIITISNDGRDIDGDVILAKAEKKGLLTKPREEYSEKEKLELILAPGFSTKENISQYSGRGVGLDVAKRNVEAIGGSVFVENNKTGGCMFTLKIPLTLAIVNGMEISVGKHGFTIPIQNIRQSFKIEEKDILHDPNGSEIILKMGEFYPLVRLSQVFSIESEAASVEESIVMWLEAGGKLYCLLVDKIIGERQVVVKPLPAYLNSYKVKENGISGCTILGDGYISLILDIVNIYQAYANL